MNTELQQFIAADILPQYDSFDAAHQQDHARKVMDESLVLAGNYDVNLDMVYAIAAYHDLGLCEGREDHHLVSGRIVRSDSRLLRWFTPEQIEVMDGSWQKPTETSISMSSSPAPCNTDWLIILNWMRKGTSIVPCNTYTKNTAVTVI